MERGSLYHYLRQSHSQSPSSTSVINPPPLTLSHRLDLMEQCARAVNHLHCIPRPHGPVLHRDIKPLNFLLDRHGTVKIGDFGLSKVRLSSRVMSTARGVGGSVRWMAPELFEGSSHASTASDIYALGMVLYEIVTTQIPWPNDRDPAIIAMIIRGKRPPLPEGEDDADDIPADLRSLIQSCWHEEASERPNALQVIATLKKIRTHVQATQQTLPSPISAFTPTAPVTPHPTLEVNVANAETVQSQSSSSRSSGNTDPSQPPPVQSASILTSSSSMQTVVHPTHIPLKHAPTSPQQQQQQEQAEQQQQQQRCQLAYLHQWSCKGKRGKPETPSGIAISPEHQLIFITDYYKHRVNVHTLDGTFVRRWGTKGAMSWSKWRRANGELRNPTGIAIKNETAFIVDSGNHRIQLLTLDGEFIRAFGKKGKSQGEFNDPFGIAVTDSSIYVTDRENNRVQVFDWNGKFIRQWGTFGNKASQFHFPYGICAADGHVYVCDTMNHRIQVFDEEGRFIHMWGKYGDKGGEFNGPIGIHVSGGRVFVADLDNYRVQVFASNRCFLTMVGTKEDEEGDGAGAGMFNRVWAVDVLDYRLYVADSSNKHIQVFEIDVEP